MSEELKKVYESAVNIIRFAPQFSKVLSVKLKMKGFASADIDEVIERLKEEDLLNDRKYALIYADSVIKKNPVGKAMLEMKLMEKGIDREMSKEIVTEIFREESEDDVFERYVAGNLNKIKSLIDSENYSSLHLKLSSSGFGGYRIGKIKKIISKISATNGDECFDDDFID